MYKLALNRLVLLAICFCFSAIALAEPLLGQQFERTGSTINSDNPNKIEVVELFWYGCIHCYQMEPMLEAWINNLPKDVYFKRIPALPRPDWMPMAKAYYAMDDLGVLTKLHNRLFDAIHKQRSLQPTSETATIDWISLQSGLDKNKVQTAFNSFSMQNRLNRATQFFRASNATGVPSLIIDGEYITSSTMAGNYEQALKTADYLIANVRANKARRLK